MMRTYSRSSRTSSDTIRSYSGVLVGVDEAELAAAAMELLLLLLMLVVVDDVTLLLVLLLLLLLVLLGTMLGFPAPTLLRCRTSQLLLPLLPR